MKHAEHKWCLASGNVYKINLENKVKSVIQAVPALKPACMYSLNIGQFSLCTQHINRVWSKSKWVFHKVLIPVRAEVNAWIGTIVVTPLFSFVSGKNRASGSYPAVTLALSAFTVLFFRLHLLKFSSFQILSLASKDTFYSDELTYKLTIIYCLLQLLQSVCDVQSYAFSND